MPLSCLLYAIFTWFVLNNFFYIYIQGYVTKKSQQKYVWFRQYPFLKRLIFLPLHAKLQMMQKFYFFR